MDIRPNFYIVGAAKCGTSSLFHYLDLHPDVYMSPMKEPHYFCDNYFPDNFAGPGDDGFSRNRIRAIDEYLRLFEAGSHAKIRGEGSVYYIYFNSIAERLLEFNPEAKVVIVLRNPVQRAYSAYMHTVRDGRETLTFEEALEREESRREQGYQPLWWYRKLGLYSAQVERYINTFPPNQLKIFLFEDLRDTAKAVQETFSFLNIRANVSVDTSIKYNESGIPKSRVLFNFFAKPNILKQIVKPLLPTKVQRKLGQQAKSMTLRKETMNPQTKEMLTEYYREDIKRLQDLIGRDLSSWLVS